MESPRKRQIRKCAFDTEISKVISEIDERIRFLKGKGLFRLLSDTIAPMLKSKPSRLRVTEDFRLFFRITTTWNLPESLAEGRLFLVFTPSGRHIH